MIAFSCFNRSRRIQEKALHIADIQCFYFISELFPTLGAENGFPTQAYSSLTISALCEVFSSKVTPSMRSSCTRLHPNAFDKDSENPRYKDEPTTDSLSPIVILCNFLHSAIPFHPIATSPDLAESDARPSPWDAPYSLAADAGRSDLCGRVERDDCVSL